MKLRGSGKEEKIFAFWLILALLVIFFAYKKRTHCSHLSKGPPCTYIELVYKNGVKSSQLVCLQSSKPTLQDLLESIKIVSQKNLIQCAPHLALPVNSGDAVHIVKSPGIVRIYAGTMSDRYRFVLGLPVNINSAPPEILKALPYLTDNSVEEIVEMRKKQPFRKVAELTKVAGIGERRLKEIEPYVSCSTPSPNPVEICTIKLRSESF